MKKLIKLFTLAFAVIIITVAFSSCSKGSFGGKKYDTSSISPVAPKYAPVRKKYIVNNKRRPILGLDRR